MDTLIKGIPDELQEKRGWKVYLNGEEVLKVNSVKIVNPKFGELNYGLTPGGYDAWSFREVAGGGVVTIPFSIIDGDIYVGLVEQMRHNQGGKIWNVARGFLNPGETNFQALIREYEEEVRYAGPDKRIKPLEGENMNPNSAFFETPEKTDGVKFFSLEVLPSQLELDIELGAYRFKAGLLQPTNRQAELIYNSRFFSWRTAVQVGDMFTIAAVGRLLAAQLVR